MRVSQIDSARPNIFRPDSCLALSHGRSRPVLSGMCPVGTPHWTDPLPPGFSQVFILNVLKVACFHTLLQVFILKVLSWTGFGGRSQVKEQNEERSLERLMDTGVSRKKV